MAITWNQVFVGAGLRRCHELIIHDGKLWFVSSEQNASGYAGALYYTEDGDNWTEDNNWRKPTELWNNSMEETSHRFTGPFVHDGYLYMACNHYPASVAERHGHLYRRETDGTWTLVFEEVEQSSPAYRYCRGASDGTNIILVGTVYRSGSPNLKAVIWRITGAVKTIEYEDRVHSGNDRGWDAFWSTEDQEWYASTDSAIHERDGGLWTVVYNTGDAWAFREGGVFYQEYADRLWCNDHRRYAGAWEDKEHPSGDPNINGIYKWGRQLMFCEHLTGELYTYSDQWNQWTAPPLASPGLESVIEYKENIYVAGYSGFAGRVWRLEFSHDTTPGLWSVGVRPTGRQLVCDHEFGDTIYFGVYDSDGLPIWMKIDDQLEEWMDLMVPTSSSGSLIQTQSALVRDTAYAFGRFSSFNQIFITDDAGLTLDNCDNDAWVDDSISTMEYLDDEDLTITHLNDKEMLRTLDGLSPWTKRGDIPGTPLSQVRDGDNIFVGCTAGSANLYLSEDIGQTYAVKGVGLPTDVDIRDLELA